MGNAKNSFRAISPMENSVQMAASENFVESDFVCWVMEVMDSMR